MAGGLKRALNIETGEGNRVLFLIIQSVFLGIFLGTFDISAHAMFLEEYESSMIPKAYFVSGMVGIFLTTIYTWLQSRIRFSVFAVINLLFVGILTFLLRFSFGMYDTPWLPFIVMVMMGPLNIIAVLGFWGTVGRMFSLRQGKRLFGLIDTGQILGIIISSYAIPVILSFQVATRDLLYISTASILFALLLQVVLSGRYRTQLAVRTERKEDRSGSGFFTLFRNRYIFYMSLFAMLLISVTMFVQFSFLAVAKENYPNPGDLAAFLGYFSGTLMIFTVMLKTFVYGRLMKTWGLKLVLVAAPALILFFIAVAAVVGGFFGYTLASGAFTFFFLIISVSKLFTKSLQDSFVAPSMKILYQSLDTKIRYSIQARIDGTINEISVLFSSLLGAGLGALSFFGIIHYTYVLLALLAALIFMAFKLYSAYKESLRKSLEKFQETESGIKLTGIVDRLKNDLAGESLTALFRAIRFSEWIDFTEFRNSILRMLGNASQAVRSISLRFIGEKNLVFTGKEIRESLIKEKSGDNGKLAAGILESMDARRNKKLSKDEMIMLTKSARPEDRKLVALSLFELSEFDHLAVVNTLLRDPDPAVKSLSMLAAACWKVSETAAVLVEFLHTAYYRQAFDALVGIGDEAVEALEHAYYKSGVDRQTLMRVTSVLGRIATEKAIGYLLNKIGKPDRIVAIQSLRSLRSIDYQADEESLPGIIESAKTVVSLIAWNLAAEYTIEENNMGDRMAKAIREELELAYDQLYLLLSLAYDPNSIHHIRENLESGTSEGIGFAIELLDLFVSEDIKPLLFPVLEDTKVVEKIRQLQVEIPIEIMEPYDLLLSMINRDPNYLNPYTKALALISLQNYRERGLTDDLVAQVFNPDLLLSELAAREIQALDKEAFRKIKERIHSERMAYLNRLFGGSGEKKRNLIIDRIFFLEQLPHFSSLRGEKLYLIAQAMEDLNMQDKEEIVLSAAGSETGYVFLLEGKITQSLNGKEIGTLNPKELMGGLPFILTDKDRMVLRSEGISRLFSIDQKIINELIFDHPDIALVFYSWHGEVQKNGIIEVNMETVI